MKQEKQVKLKIFANVVRGEGEDADKENIRITSGPAIEKAERYDVTILLETMAGKGSEVGRSFEEIKQIIEENNTYSSIYIMVDTLKYLHKAINLSQLITLFKNK